MNKKTRYGIVIGLVVVFVGLFIWYKATPGPYDALAQCLNDQGAKYYGAFWCPVCQRQKQAFAKSAKYLPYVECSNPDKSQNETCKQMEIESYPTWIFADGERRNGLLEPSVLAEITSCPMQ